MQIFKYGFAGFSFGEKDLTNIGPNTSFLS